MSWNSIEAIKQANARAGYFYFSPATMRHFNSRVLSDVYGGRYFITSERREGHPRLFTVCECTEEGRVLCVSAFGQYATRREAIKAAQALGDAT